MFKRITLTYLLIFNLNDIVRVDRFVHMVHVLLSIQIIDNDADLSSGKQYFYGY